MSDDRIAEDLKRAEAMIEEVMKPDSEWRTLGLLQEYVQHKPECYLTRTILVDGKPLKKCTCGLSALLKELEGVKRMGSRGSC